MGWRQTRGKPDEFFFFFEWMNVTSMCRREEEKGGKDRRRRESTLARLSAAEGTERSLQTLVIPLLLM